MPTFLGQTFTGTWTGRPPRMSEQDFAIWKRWHPAIMGQIRRMWFDVGLGGGQPIPPNTTAELAFMWTRNTQKRADVIIETDQMIWLVELRFAAQPNAIGRLLVYFDDLQDDNPFDKPLRLFLVTDREDPEVRRTATRRGINYVVI